MNEDYCREDAVAAGTDRRPRLIPKREEPVTATEPTVNPWEELNRLRKAARLALAYTHHMRATVGMGPKEIAQAAAYLDGHGWATLAKQGFLTRPSEATIALAVELLASAARHPSAQGPGSHNTSRSEYRQGRKLTP